VFFQLQGLQIELNHRPGNDRVIRCEADTRLKSALVIEFFVALKFSEEVFFEI
jgi:hypothetical protein